MYEPISTCFLARLITSGIEVNGENNQGENSTYSTTMTLQSIIIALKLSLKAFYSD